MKLKKTARLAGLIYFILIISGIFNLMYIPSKLIVWNNAVKTIENITQSEQLFRFGILSGIICFSCFLILPLILYKLLHHINKTYAMLMVLFAVVSVPISFVTMLHHFSVLTLIGNEPFLEGLDKVQLQTEIMLHLSYFFDGVQIAQIFWGLWLLPFGYLVFKSNFLPKFFGIFLMIGCFGYLIEFFGSLLFNDYSKNIISDFVGIPASIGEIGICLWLLIVGVREKNTEKSDIEI
ncbi:DUF4386 domain-containing protein [Flavobacterium sp.]|uniref:DUF4386 domain-containing protein n=1 Tax=Flavobacterium sp. TaxID=239 RepID=UPI00286DE17C|nr:DUF4386 domain-containing protein [Flavobacterium sp.]